MDPMTARKSTPVSHTKAGFRMLVSSDLYAFAKEVIYHGDPQNGLCDRFHKPLCQWVQTTPYAENLYLLFRGCFKTTLLTVIRNVQRLLATPGDPAWGGRQCGPNTRILILSNKAENAEPMLAGIQQMLVHPMIMWAFPEVLGNDPSKLPTWTKSDIQLLRPNRMLRGSTVKAVGITGELTSQHYDHLSADDVIGKENSQTKDMRENVVDFMKKIRPLFDPIGSDGGITTRDYVGTHWHYDDYYSRLKLEVKTRGRKLGIYQVPAWEPASVGEVGARDIGGVGWRRLTFPERFSFDWLLGERQDMGSSDFAAQYLLDPVSSDTQHFKRGKLDVVARADMPPWDELWICMTVDPAASLKKWADWTAIAVGGFDHQGDLWLLELRRMKHDEYALSQAIFELHREFPRVMAVGIEATGFQKGLFTILNMEGSRRGYQLPLVKLERDTRVTKGVRIGSLQAPWEAGQIHALNSCEALDDFRDEADKFRTDKDSAHDDLLDTVADLYQVRGIPGARGTRVTPYTDREVEVNERREFEEALLTRKPWLDPASLRMAWFTHRSDQAAEEARLAWALGAGDEEYVG